MIDKPNSDKDALRFLDAAKVINLPREGVKNQLALATAEGLIGISRLNAIMSDLGPDWPSVSVIVQHLFKRLDIDWTVTNPEVLDSLDDKPKVFVLNHPYGLPDALALHEMLLPVRPNIKIFANTLLAATKVDAERLLFVDPFMAPQNRALNRRSVAGAMQHLRAGGDLALFPGRICSHQRPGNPVVSDGPWTDQILRFVEVSGGDLVPIHVSGQNSALFNKAGLVHPRLRTLLILREFLSGGHRFTFTIGEPVERRQLQRMATIIPPGKFARTLTYLQNPQLGKADTVTTSPTTSGSIEEANGSHSKATVNSQTSKTGFVFEKANLDHLQHLLRHKEFSVYRTSEGLESSLIGGISHLRYEAFSSDANIGDPGEMIDRYDEHYSHLILWDHEREAMAGTYRFKLPGKSEISHPDGLPGGSDIDNLVSSSIFDLSRGFEKFLPRSAELGRAAIGLDYQKSYAPLLLLWRGILSVIRDEKQIKYLFGPVTMGSSFLPLSREILHRFIMKHSVHEDMVDLVAARRELELVVPPEVNIDAIVNACENLSDVATLVEGFENGKRKLPVLFRHYANFGSRYISFGEWKELDGATAGLTVLNLQEAREDFLSRYVGEEGLADFRNRH